MAADRPNSRRIPLRGPLPLFAPPKHVHPGDVEAILDEFEGGLGVILWKAVRAVDLWAQRENRARQALFSEGVASRWSRELAEIPNPPASMDAIRALFRELAGPRRADHEAVAGLCLRVSGWAEGNESLATAVAFAEGAALARDTAAGPCLTAGRLLKRRAAYARAEMWLQRALALAIPAADRTTTAQAWSELGTVFALRGALRSAEACHLRALRTARRHHLNQHQGIALHDLFVTAMHTGDRIRAQRYARQATRAYYPGHPRLAAFANDVAYFWMLNGEFFAALRLFLAVLPRITDSNEHLFVAANVIRAAGGAGRRDVLESFWSQTLVGLQDQRGMAAKAWALLELARGAESLGEWERAEAVVTEAIRHAEHNGEHRLLFEAEAVRDSISRRTTTGIPKVSTPPYLSDCGILADELEGCLLRATTLAWSPSARS